MTRNKARPNALPDFTENQTGTASKNLQFVRRSALSHIEHQRAATTRG